MNTQLRPVPKSIASGTLSLAAGSSIWLRPRRRLWRCGKLDQETLGRFRNRRLAVCLSGRCCGERCRRKEVMGLLEEGAPPRRSHWSCGHRIYPGPYSSVPSGNARKAKRTRFWFGSLHLFAVLAFRRACGSRAGKH